MLKWEIDRRAGSSKCSFNFWKCELSGNVTLSGSECAYIRGNQFPKFCSLCLNVLWCRQVWSVLALPYQPIGLCRQSGTPFFVILFFGWWWAATHGCAQGLILALCSGIYSRDSILSLGLNLNGLFARPTTHPCIQLLLPHPHFCFLFLMKLSPSILGYFSLLFGKFAEPWNEGVFPESAVLPSRIWGHYPSGHLEHFELSSLFEVLSIGCKFWWGRFVCIFSRIFFFSSAMLSSRQHYFVPPGWGTGLFPWNSSLGWFLGGFFPKALYSCKNWSSDMPLWG